jgi:hypothetical protein
MPSLMTLVRWCLIMGVTTLLVTSGMMIVITPVVGLWERGLLWETIVDTVGAPWLWLGLLAIVVGGLFLYTGGGSDSRSSGSTLAEVWTAYTRRERSDEESDE